MQRRYCLRWSLGLAAGLMSGRLIAGPAPIDSTRHPHALIWRERLLIGFGTTLWLKAAHEHADPLEAALAASVNEIRQIERQMSLFDPDSALSRLNREGRLSHPDRRLLDVLDLSAHVARRSSGAFDVSMQPLWQVWSAAATDGRLPSHRLVQQAQRRVNWRAVDANACRIRLNRSGMQLSLNGIAQGYAVDRVRATLQRFGIRHALIDTGETGLLGHGPDAVPWTAAIESAAVNMPSATAALLAPRFSLDGRAIATSSDAHTSFSTDHRHHHILNPKTGYSPRHWSSVSVIASSGALADALTKVFFMLPPSRVLSEAQRWGVEVVLQDKQGQWHASDPTLIAREPYPG